MEVQCPSCASRFHLPDTVLKPRVKLRCSVCKHVFTYEKPHDSSNAQQFDAAPSAGNDLNLDSAMGEAPASTAAPKKKTRNILLVLCVILLACGGGAWWYVQNMLQVPVDNVAQVAQDVKLMTMRNVRQYYVENEKVGPIFVVEGRVVNEFPVPKELIEVEAAVYGKDKNALVTKTQLAGTALSLFQLQVLEKEELESFLNNQIEILTKNTNVPSGGEVPFMILFYNPPADVAEFGVKIVSAKDVEAEE